MSRLSTAYAAGQRDALARFKLSASAPAPTHPVVKQTMAPAKPPAPKPSALDPTAFSQVFNTHEQSKTRLEHNRKLAAEWQPCTTCRQPRHYGACKKTRVNTAPEGVPAASGFSDLSRQTQPADEPGRMSGGNKISSHERRGPTDWNRRYRTNNQTLIGDGDSDSARIQRMFNQVDQAPDATSLGGGMGEPIPGPAVG